MREYISIILRFITEEGIYTLISLRYIHNVGKIDQSELPAPEKKISLKEQYI